MKWTYPFITCHWHASITCHLTSTKYSYCLRLFLCEFLTTTLKEEGEVLFFSHEIRETLRQIQTRCTLRKNPSFDPTCSCSSEHDFWRVAPRELDLFRPLHKTEILCAITLNKHFIADSSTFGIKFYLLIRIQSQSLEVITWLTK